MESISTRFLSEHRPTEQEKEDGEQASQRQSHVALSPDPVGSNAPPHASITKQEPVVEQPEEDFVHIGSSTGSLESLPTQDNLQHELLVIPDIKQPESSIACSDHPHLTAESTLDAEQGKEGPSDLHTTPYDSSRPLNRTQDPPGMPGGFTSHHRDTIGVTPPTALDTEQSVAHYDPPCSTKSDLVANQREQATYSYAPNIVIFGETGVGKSSMINLIAGRKLADTSNDALGCTFEHVPYLVTVDGVKCTLWDTTGLDEGTDGTVPAKAAEKNLRELMGNLAHSGGIHLIIYCIRGSRLTRALKRNYDLFYVTVCRKKVHVALVVTGLEHHPEEMETWWGANETALRRYEMRFDAHACVTTLDVRDHTLQQRRSESQKRLRELVAKYSKLPAWRSNPSLVQWVWPMIRNGLRMGRTATTRKVFVCGSFTDPLSGTNTVWNDGIRRIGDRQYNFVQVDEYTPHRSKTLENVGALVFHTSLTNEGIPSKDVYPLRRLYHTANGQLCPVIVALEGCPDDESAEVCRNTLFSQHSDINAHFFPLPSTPRDARAKLDEMVERFYVDPVEVKGLNSFEKLAATLGCLPM